MARFPCLWPPDIAARGIDIADVSLVVHVDPPAEHKAYLHRAGRTARGGASGAVVTLVMDQQRDEVAKLIKKAGVKAFELDLSDRPNPAGAPELAKITGARKPSGEPLPPPHQNNPLRGAVVPSARTLATSLDNLDAADTVAVVAVVARVAAAVETVPAMESQGARAAEVVVSANAAAAQRVASPLRCACCTC